MPSSPVRLADLAGAAEEVGATSARSAKVARLAQVLRALTREQVEPAVGILTGRVRQGRLGVGWRSVADLTVAPAAAPTLTVGDVDAVLQELADLGGEGSAQQRRALLADLWGRATEAEQRLLARVLLGELRIGALDGLMVDALAVAAGMPLAAIRRAVMLSGSLGHTAYVALTGALADVEAIGLTVGVPVLPMLASSAPDVNAALAITGAAAVEYKLDGARIQVHRWGGGPGAAPLVRVFSRTLADVTERVPEIVEVVSGFPGGDLVLDGETLALDEAGRPRAFQDTMSRFGASGGERVLRPWFFDVLHADGTDLVDEPLSRRRPVLRAVVGASGIPGEVTDDPAVAVQVAEAALAAGHEGVVVKALDSSYAAGRRGKAWVKVKPVHTYDLVVLAAEWGSGRRTGWLSNLHLGARDPGVPLGDDGAFVMVGKTFKGLTDDLLRWQTEQLLARQTRATRYAVHVEPGLVVEIAIDGVQRSSRYPGGVALRFARVKRYREDKSAGDADTIGSLRALL